MNKKSTQTNGGSRAKLQFSAAEWAIMGCTATILLGSILPWTLVPYPMNLWNSTSLFMLGVGVLLPIVYTVMMVTPTLSAWAGSKKHSGGATARSWREAVQARAKKMKIGSLSARQFGQVAAWLSASYFAIHLLTTLSPILLIGLVGAVGLVLITVLDRQIFGREIHPANVGQIRESDVTLLPQPEKSKTESVPEPDMQTQAETIDDIQQREAQEPPRPTKPTTSGGVPIIAAEDALAAAAKKANGATETRRADEPADQKTQAVASEDNSTENPQPAADRTQAISVPETNQAEPERADATQAIEPVRERQREETPVISAQRSASFDEPRYRPEEAFWFAVQYARPVVTESTGAHAFTVQPGNWVLALAEREDGFIVRSDSGAVGLMRDVQNIERA